MSELLQERRKARSGFWTYENRLVAVGTLASGISGLDAQAIYYLMPFVARDLHLSNSQIGLLALAVLLGWSISSLVIGPLSDRMGRRKPFLVGAFALFALFSALSAVARSFGTLFASRLLMGLAEGPVAPIQSAMVLAESSPHRRGLNMGLVYNFGGHLFGTLLGPLVMVALAVTIGWRAAFLIAGVPGLIMAIVIARVLREPPRADEEENAPIAPRVGTWARIREVLRYRNVLLCLLIGATISGWFTLLLTFLPLWSVNVLAFSPRMMSVVMSAAGVAGVVAAIVVPALSDRYGRRPVMTLFSLIAVVTPAAALMLGPDPLLLGVCVFLGFMATGIVPLFAGTVPLETVSAENAATASAVAVSVSQIGGGVIGPMMAGFLADRYGLAAALWLALALALLTVAASACLRETAPRARRRRCKG